MKKLITILIFSLLMISATEYRPPANFHPTIEGTWELVSFYNYEDGVTPSDTLLIADGYRQIKMYYNGKVMWTRYVPNDSVEWFGYGSYETTDSTLTEKLEYMSASMRKITNSDMLWDMELLLEKDRYSQIFTDGEGNRINSENYKRLD
ncbi:hypothetical protein SAMN05421766_10329 [Zobellia uliginosa]|uniref:Lipocalin-like domain-containing protein n=1 Tax=Zobellia uliginosa TaxID=143224 RepID=A0ABY1KPW3_9FLAO|nr:hypothetical protein [Zobellia uliginosa]SIS63219.1 hypothetical protein SAMN05421766_10329 [Zobellia uliginosa]